MKGTLSNQTESSILLYDGGWFDFKNPSKCEFHIETVGHALSNLCRYTGHSKKFYSVAEHSVLVSQIVPKQFGLEGLMHDASEAFCGDVSSPLKKLMPQFKRIEERVQAAIFKFYGLQYPIPSCVHDADKIAYVTERKTISNTGRDSLWYTEYSPAKFKVIGYSPEEACERFLKRFKELTNDRNAILRSETETGAKAA